LLGRFVTILAATAALSLGRLCEYFRGLGRSAENDVPCLLVERVAISHGALHGEVKLSYKHIKIDHFLAWQLYFEVLEIRI
jgi:hypothetical protein